MPRLKAPLTHHLTIHPPPIWPRPCLSPPSHPPTCLTAPADPATRVPQTVFVQSYSLHLGVFFLPWETHSPPVTHVTPWSRTLFILAWLGSHTTFPERMCEFQDRQDRALEMSFYGNKSNSSLGNLASGNESSKQRYAVARRTEVSWVKTYVTLRWPEKMLEEMLGRKSMILPFF